MSSQQRLYQRLNLMELSQPVRGTLFLLDNSTLEITFKDFSKSGSGVFVAKSIEPQTIIRMLIHGCKYPPLEGRVVWSGPDPQGPPGLPFRLGIDFMPKDDAARENQISVYRYICQIVKPPSLQT